MTTKEIIDLIFKDPSVKYDLTEFEGQSKKIEEMITIYEKEGTGKDTGKKKYFLKPLAPVHSGKTEFQVYTEDGKSNPEEIVRQLWLYKLINFYGYHIDEIELEIPVQFGTEVGTKFADVAVYRDNTKQTVKLLFEVKKPKRKEGIEQLKSYIGAKGLPVGIWSNGTDRLILYKPDNKDFDTLSDIPKRGQEINDVLERRRTLADLDKTFNFKKIIQDLEELVLADSGVDEFNEIFKLIFAKIWDEKEADENHRTRPNKEIDFYKFADSELTYQRINSLFNNASTEWPGVFEENENIKLRKDHLQVCIGPLERVRLLGSNLRIMDDAFEYLLPTEAKKKKGQFFTPRYVIDMCVRMLNPQDNEYVIDPACGSAGFLMHAMEWVWPADTKEERFNRKHRYAAKYLWGIDFEARAAKTSRALMLIAGDGHSNIFGPDVSSLDPRTWYNTKSGKLLISELSKTPLLKNRIPNNETLNDEDKAWEYFDDFNFDVILTNPPFAGEMKDKKMLVKYELAKPALNRAKDKQAKEERDVLFIERVIKLLKPGGRAAIVLPQGKFNNSSLAFIREWILRKARLLAVVGLHQNTFKPHTGVKTSVLFIQKYTLVELDKIEKIKEKVAAGCPDYELQIEKLISEEVPISDSNIDTLVGKKLFENISRNWVEDFTDDDTGEIISIKREEIIYKNGIILDNDIITSLIKNKIPKIIIEKDIVDINEDDIPENILELLQEEFPEPEQEIAEEDENKKEDENKVSEETENSEYTLEEKIELANEKVDSLKDQLIKAKQKLADLGIQMEALDLNEKTELELLKDKKADRTEVNELKSEYKTKRDELKLIQKEQIKVLNAEIKTISNKLLPFTIEELLLLTNKGKLSLILADPYKLNKLYERYKDAKVAEELDYPIFMAVSEIGGKNNSGDYELLIDDEGSIVEDETSGQPMIKQDLVNYNISKQQLEKGINTIPKENLCIAEAFIKFAVEQDFDFWKKH